MYVQMRRIIKNINSTFIIPKIFAVRILSSKTFFVEPFELIETYRGYIQVCRLTYFNDIHDRFSNGIRRYVTENNEICSIISKPLVLYIYR